MLITVGNRVRFKLTGEEATVTELLGEGMAFVRLAGDETLEIPVFIEDLERVETSQHLGFKAKIVKGKQLLEEKKSQPLRPEPERQYLLLKEGGIQLAFLPITKTPAQNETTHYELYLINATHHIILFSFSLETKTRTIIKRDGKIEANESILLDSLVYDLLSDQPDVHFSCWRMTAQGTENSRHITLKIRPKQFFKNLKTAVLLNKPAYVFALMKNFETPLAASPKEESLSDYTKRNLSDGNTKKRFSDDIRLVEMFDVKAIAHFVPEIDLHIERLTNKHSKMTKTEIINIQLKHFENFIERAMRLGVERVFIIHGVGTGLLRNEVAERLAKMSNVASFKNEYHPKYGYGATEVLFR